MSKTTQVTTQMTNNEPAPLDAARAYLKRPYGRVVTPEEDGTFRAEVIEFAGCLATATTASRALKKLEDVAESWLMSVLEKGQPVPEPFDGEGEFSGKLVLRIPRSLHRKAAWAAEREGVSLNQFIGTALAETVGERRATRRVFLSFAHARVATWTRSTSSISSDRDTVGKLVPLSGMQTIEVKVNA